MFLFSPFFFLLSFFGKKPSPIAGWWKEKRELPAHKQQTNESEFHKMTATVVIPLLLLLLPLFSGAAYCQNPAWAKPGPRSILEIIRTYAVLYTTCVFMYSKRNREGKRRVVSLLQYCNSSYGSVSRAVYCTSWMTRINIYNSWKKTQARLDLWKLPQQLGDIFYSQRNLCRCPSSAILIWERGGKWFLWRIKFYFMADNEVVRCYNAYRQQHAAALQGTELKTQEWRLLQSIG